MIIGIFGASLTGKTTLSRMLGARLALPLRSCGEVVKLKATELRVAVSNLTDDAHRSIDWATVDWASSTQPCVVEGRFLNCVLAPLETNTVLIRLEASPVVRCERWSTRLGRSVSVAELEALDSSDLDFRCRMYNHEPMTPLLTLSTSEASAEACVEQLTSFLDAVRRQRD